MAASGRVVSSVVGWVINVDLFIWQRLLAQRVGVRVVTHTLVVKQEDELMPLHIVGVDAIDFGSKAV